MTRRAAIYTRISRDRQGAGLGVERQQDDCRELAERLGATVVAVHVDNDLSAYTGKPRPGYRALLADVRGGRVDVVLCWHTDRLHRSPVELEEWIAASEQHGVAVHTVKAGPLDLATPSGRMVARQLGAVARYEVEHTIERQKAAKAQAAAAGRWRGGRRPYGYEHDGVTVRADEAAVVVDATERVLAGESLHSIVRDLNRRGVRTSTGREWKPPALRDMLLRARNAGLVEHEREPVADAEWPALVDPAHWRNLRRLLTAPGRRQPQSADQRWLGSGLYLCGRCCDGTTMLSATGNTRTGGGGRVPAYRCRGGPHLFRVAELVDELVTALVLERLSRPDARLLLAPADRRVDVEVLHARREDVDKRLREAAGLFAQRAITGAQLTEVTAQLQDEASDLDALIEASAAASPLAGFADATDVRLAWDAATVARRKAVIRALMDVTILPATRGRPAGWRSGQSYFDPSTVRIDWRSPVDDDADVHSSRVSRLDPTRSST